MLLLLFQFATSGFAAFVLEIGEFDVFGKIVVGTCFCEYIRRTVFYDERIQFRPIQVSDLSYKNMVEAVINEFIMFILYQTPLKGQHAPVSLKAEYIDQFIEVEANAPSFSSGTLGLAPQDAGVGSATLNTAQQVGGSIGTALLNTLAASAASSYLLNLTHTAGNAQAAALRGDTTAFLWSAFAFAAGGIAAGLAMRSGGLAELANRPSVMTPEEGAGGPAPTAIVQVPVGCRAC